MKKYKGAIIGCGLIAEFHANAYGKNTKLVAVCDKRLKNAKKLAEKFNVPKVYKDYIEMLDKEELDFVEILTNHVSHLEIVKEAASRNIHINLQKVPTPTLDEFNQIKDVAKDQKIKLRVIENFRYYEPYQFAKDLIKKGKIGDVQIVNIKKWGGLKKGFQGGMQRIRAYRWRIKESENYSHPILFDDGYHKHSLVEWFLGEPIEKVRAWCSYTNVVPGVKIDTPNQVQYFTKSDKLGTFQNMNLGIEVTNNFYPCDEIVEIIGNKGIILIFGGHGELFKEGPLKQGVYWISKSKKWNFSDEMNIDIRNSFDKAMDEFVDFMKGKDNLVFNMKDAENALRAGIAIVKSLRNDSSMVYLKELV